MLTTLTLLSALTLGGSPAVESVCHKLAPATGAEIWTRTPGRTQAVVLIHGFHYHFTDASVPKAEFRPWQRADNPLVKELARNADVYALAYGQNASIDTIVRESKLGDTVARLRNLGYSDVVLIGHSAGGLIARHFVEDFADAGVTKVIQVGAPNGGTGLAEFHVPKSQKAFTECLTKEGRSICVEQRTNAKKFIPAHVQFVCVVAKGDGKSVSDGVVRCDCQWTPDLQKQGIPAIGVLGNHRDVVREAKAAATLSKLVRDTQPRWPADRIDKARKEILGK